jgi:hypothetical protein
LTRNNNYFETEQDSCQDNILKRGREKCKAKKLAGGAGRGKGGRHKFLFG